MSGRSSLTIVLVVILTLNVEICTVLAGPPLIDRIPGGVSDRLGEVINHDIHLSSGPEGRPGVPYIDHLAGEPISSSPFFFHKEVFVEGQDLYAAVSPSRYPCKAGDYYNIYVVEHKTFQQWRRDPLLVDVTPDGYERARLSDGTLEANTTVVWRDMMLTRGMLHKEYDVVFDFDNNGRYDVRTDILDNIGVTERYPATGGFTLVKDPYLLGSNVPIPQFDYDLGWNDDLGFEITGRIYSPALTSAGSPLVIIAHAYCAGHTNCENSYQGYGNLGAKLASRGFFVVSIGLQGTIIGDRAEAIVAHMKSLLLDPTDALDPGARLHFNLLRENVNPTRVGLIGHSMSGWGVVKAQELWEALDPRSPYRIKAIAGLAPADYEPTVFPRAPYLLIHGTRDASVKSGVGLNIFERTERKWPRHLISLYGGNHWYFNSMMPSPDMSFDPSISQFEQRKLTTTFITAFFSSYLLNQQAYGEFLSGRVVPPSVEEVATTLLYTSQRSNSFGLLVDDFEADGFEYNSLGELNSGFGMLFTEGSIPPPWGEPIHWYRNERDNRGLVASKPQQSSDASSIKFGVGDRDVSRYDFLSFRIAWISLPQYASFPLLVEIRDADDNFSRIEAQPFLGNFPKGPLPRPDFSDHEDFRPKPIMETVQIPLRAFTTHEPTLNLGRITDINLVMDGLHGAIFLDDVEFIGHDLSEPDNLPPGRYFCPGPIVIPAPGCNHCEPVP